MENIQVPRADITICVDPPTDNTIQGPSSSDPVYWAPEHYASNAVQQGTYQEYPVSSPQSMSPRINIPYNDTQSPAGAWEARSPCSSDSGWSNPSSPHNESFGEEFREDGSDYLSEGNSHVSDVQYQQEFDFEAYLNMDNVSIQSPNTLSPTQYMSGPDPFQMSSSAPGSSVFTHQSLQYTPPNMSGQHSPTSSLDFANGFPAPMQNGNGQYSSQTQMKPTHHRSSSDFLLPPSPTMKRSRSVSRGPVRTHRSTISEGSNLTNLFMNPPIDVNQESLTFLGDDLRGRGLARAKTAPSVQVIAKGRGRSPYDRPPSQNDIHNQLIIPTYSGPVSGHSTPPTPEFESSSPGSIKDVVATEAMVEASNRRRRREPGYFCSQCGNSFTTENSKKRHERSHSGLKPYICTITGCGQTFSNDDDRKRHENKSKKHAQ